MLYALICTDKPNSIELRAKVRPEHVAYLNGLGNVMKFAGPFLDAAGNSNGSLVMIEAENHSVAEHLASQDPYNLAGLFASVEIRPWKWTLKNPEAK